MKKLPRIILTDIDGVAFDIMAYLRENHEN